MMQCRWRRVPALLRHSVRTTHTHSHKLSHHIQQDDHTNTHAHTHTHTHTHGHTHTHTPTSSPPIVLRPYQEACIDACLEALSTGSTRIGVSLPTGAGKTTVFIALLSRMAAPAHDARATRVLIIVNTIELARQSAAQVQRMFPAWKVDIEQGAQHNASGYADVTIATYQTLSRASRMAKFDPAMLKCIIVDEAHHAASSSYRSLLSRFNGGVSHPNAQQTPSRHKVPIIGFSATFSRPDGITLGSVFETIAYHRDFLDMIKEEWLCELRFTSVTAEMDLQRATKNGSQGDFVTSSLANIINTPEINNLVVRSWMDRAADRKSTLVFCVDVRHVMQLTQAFRAVGADARYIYSGTPAQERKELLRAFRNGEFPVLVNCAILTEGADIPNIDCVVLARPTRSRNLFSQMIGRGMRLSPQTGKVDCRIIDFVDNNDRVSGAISVPTIFGLDPSSIGYRSRHMEDATPASLAKLAEKAAKNKEKPVHKPISVLYEDFDSAADMEESNAAADDKKIDSPFVWVNCGGDVYVLETLMYGYVRVEPTGEGNAFKATYHNSIAKTRESKQIFLRPLVLVGPEKDATLRAVVNAADAYVRKNVLRSRDLQKRLMPFAPWRRQGASQAQKNYIKSRWLKNEYLAGKIGSIETMTKGQAHMELCRIHNGYIGRAKAIVKKQEKAAKNEAKKAATETRWKVQVGPMA